MLSLTLHDGLSPYDWAGEAVPSGGTVLDICCGSAPMHDHLRADRYVGLDLSAAELRRAQARGRDVAQADASALPVSTGRVDAVVVSMALMLVPFSQTVREIARVLRPAGVVVATVPTNGPLPAADVLRYARMSVALRTRGLRYPNDEALSDRTGFAHARLQVVEDTTRTFGLEIDGVERADLLLDSFYLPQVNAERVEAARRVMHGWVGRTVAVPIRRLVLQRD